MKTKLLFFLLASGLVALAAWIVHVPHSAQADDVPEKYRDTVRKGLEYLAKNQAKDGHWEGDDGKHPVAMTGLVGLALLMEKDNPRARGFGEQVTGKAKYSAQIRKAVDWLLAKSEAKRDGLIFSEHPSETARYMQGHGLATLFLAGACRDETDNIRRKKLNEVLTRAVKYIVKAQSTRGGWYDTSKVEGHDFDSIAATVIQIQALQAAENVGIPVPGDIIQGGQEYLKAAIGNYEAKAKPPQNSNRLAEIAAALACRTNLIGLGSALDESCKKWLKYCQAEIPVGRSIKLGRDELAHYYYAQTVCNLGGDTWSGYRTTMFDHLQSSQNKDGSWPASDGISVGTVYATALWCVILQLDKRSHPSARQLEFITSRGPALQPMLRFAMNSVGEPKA